mmetsp:Transcript_18098/g.56728  ORF Transcript_18098/g.56728 Transcript_18098/m.56728 type:complete len:262 (-) Transcript_18098:1075-1860(-)
MARVEVVDHVRDAHLPLARLARRREGEEDLARQLQRLHNRCAAAHVGGAQVEEGVAMRKAWLPCDEVCHESEGQLPQLQADRRAVLREVPEQVEAVPAPRRLRAPNLGPMRGRRRRLLLLLRSRRDSVESKAAEQTDAVLVKLLRGDVADARLQQSQLGHAQLRRELHDHVVDGVRHGLVLAVARVPEQANVVVRECTLEREEAEYVARALDHLRMDVLAKDALHHLLVEEPLHHRLRREPALPVHVHGRGLGVDHDRRDG